MKLNPVEKDLLLATSMDRNIFVADLRDKTKISRTQLVNKFACGAWNPQEPFNLIAGNEDGNIYGFDMRKLDKVSKLYKGHSSAVLDVAFSPTGREFVSGSFDRTLRIFEVGRGVSRDTYHAKRMQKVWAVGWRGDDQVIFFSF